MMTRRTRQQDLAGWLDCVEADDQPELHTFAHRISQDLTAVSNGLTLPYSSGQVESNVNRLKVIKRQMYTLQPYRHVCDCRALTTGYVKCGN